MTKQELIQLDFELTDPEDYAGIWSSKELENAMVVAYNRGLEDAVGKYISEREYVTNGEQNALEEVLKLKI